ncbi:transformer-2 sex-determining protein, putative [Pediculus humanus corporis]|uniref:Transformer-2 sex-determining protein, putative n=1 Tax=Pediculus humanus subsp. corporis TaxID=121224 RepID=E0VJB3_PEDHC|nr:transformer-2 sex-determining protein, putative [Pediculus humanus corporis]EEB13469.1 transformer-2 sex-determining protein, putative [Pediculus humanus corporis]
MSRYRDSGSDCKVYVGDLGSSASKQELEDAFGYYGPLRNVWVARNPPGFAFVEFEDPRDADDAVRGLDGRTVCGRRVRVEPSNGMGGRRRDRGPPPRRGRPFNPDDRCYECGERGHYARDCNRHRSSRRRLLSSNKIHVFYLALNLGYSFNHSPKMEKFFIKLFIPPLYRGIG